MEKKISKASGVAEIHNEVVGKRMTIFDRYCRRYMTGSSKRIGPIFHLGLIAGCLGYYFEYPHLSNYFII